RSGEYLFGFVELNQLTQKKEAGKLRHTGSLLHVVGHNHDGESFLELEDKLFDLAGGNGIERRAGLVHQKHLRLNGDRTGNAQALLLASGKAGARLLARRVFYLIPKGGEAQRALHDFIQALALMKAIERQSGRHIVVNRHRGKLIGVLEHHADAAANLHGGSAIVDIHVANPHSAGGTRFRHRLMHAVEAAHECGFSAARRTDHSGGVIGRNRHVDVLQSLSLTEPGVQLVDLDAHTHSSVRSLKHTPIAHPPYRTD